MIRKTSWYVSAVAMLTFVTAVYIFRAWPQVSPGDGLAVSLLVALAVVAEALAFVLPHSAAGSIAFIPYLAAVLVVPGWPAVAAVMAIRAAMELAARRSPTKGVFNTVHHGLTQSVAILVYRALGGQSLLLHAGQSLTAVTLSAGLAAMVACTMALLVNSIVISGAISLSTASSLRNVWRANNLATIGIDIAAGPLIFVFAWVYASFGPIAASALWVPILGLRQVHLAGLELAKVNQELLELMVKSIEARDPYTSGHSRRVQSYSVSIARLLGMSGADVEKVGRAALLHDVGKIYEKYAPVLAKADKLTPDEWRTMKEHPIDGANLVATMSRLQDIVPAIRHHHENWDGTGYPDGLAGELIPLESRIIMFADTIDAMTSERPYRRPLEETQVRSEIVRCRGKQFDPVIADRLLSSPLWRVLFPHSADRSAMQTPRYPSARVGTRLKLTS